MKFNYISIVANVVNVDSDIGRRTWHFRNVAKWDLCEKCRIQRWKMVRRVGNDKGQQRSIFHPWLGSLMLRLWNLPTSTSSVPVASFRLGHRSSTGSQKVKYRPPFDLFKQQQQFRDLIAFCTCLIRQPMGVHYGTTFLEEIFNSALLNSCLKRFKSNGELFQYPFQYNFSRRGTFSKAYCY